MLQRPTYKDYWRLKHQKWLNQNKPSLQKEKDAKLSIKEKVSERNPSTWTFGSKHSEADKTEIYKCVKSISKQKKNDSRLPNRFVITEDLW